MSRFVLGVLRNAREPLASRDIASLLKFRARRMGLKLLRLMMERVRGAPRD